MLTLESFVAVTLAGFALSVTPGPSMLYVLSRSVGQSRTAGLASAFGLAIGGVLLAVATALGLAALFAKFEVLVVVLKYVGSAYLVWLGLNMIRDVYATSDFKFDAEEVEPSKITSVIGQGVLVELLNPKTVLFFALFLPPFVDLAGGDAVSVQMQLLILGALVPLTAIPSDLVIAFMGGTLASKFNENPGFRTALAWIGGILLIAIAINLHMDFL